MHWALLDMSVLVVDILCINFPAIQIGLNMMEYLVAEGGSVNVTVAVNGSVTVTGNIMVTLTADSSEL